MHDFTNCKYLKSKQKPVHLYSMRYFLHNETAVEETVPEEKFSLALLNVVTNLGFSPKYIGSAFIILLLKCFMCYDSFDYKSSLKICARYIGVSTKFYIGCIRTSISKNPDFLQFISKVLDVPPHKLPSKPNIPQILEMLGAATVIKYNFKIDSFTDYKDLPSLEYARMIFENGH